MPIGRKCSKFWNDGHPKWNWQEKGERDRELLEICTLIYIRVHQIQIETHSLLSAKYNFSVFSLV